MCMIELNMTQKILFEKNELSLVNTTVVFTGMEARLLSSN